MCKLLIIPGLKKDKYKTAWKFIHHMSDLMSESNDDGLGYSAVDHDGNLYGERWLFNEEAFQSRDRFTKPKKRDYKSVDKVKEMFNDFIKFEDEPNITPIEKYNSFGNLESSLAAITLHTRMATSGKEFVNTHPFVDLDKDTSVVHNGIIRNHSKEDQIRSTCDSERILNKYLEHEIMHVPSDMQNMVDDIKGYFACGIFSRDKGGNRILDIFKTRAKLSAAYIKELDTVVFSTDIDDVKNTCYQLGLTIVSKCASVSEDMLLRINPITGEKILTLKYTDTTNRDTTVTSNYTSNLSSSYGFGDINDKSFKRWQKRQEKRNKNNNVITFKSEADHQSVSTEELSLMYKGYSLEAARQQIKRTNEQTNPQTVNNFAIEEINKLNEIIERNSVPNMNEEDAGMDDWYLDGYSDVWIKRTGTKN